MFQARHDPNHKWGARLVSFLRAWSSTGHLVRTLITIFWDIKSFFWVMSVMLLTFVFAFLLPPVRSASLC